MRSTCLQLFAQSWTIKVGKGKPQLTIYILNGNGLGVQYNCKGIGVFETITETSRNYPSAVAIKREALSKNFPHTLSLRAMRRLKEWVFIISHRLHSLNADGNGHFACPKHCSIQFLKHGQEKILYSLRFVNNSLVRGIF